MNVKWLAGLSTEDDKENFRRSVLQSKIVLDKLQEIVYNMLVDKRDVTTKDYASASWSHEQAHRNGYCEALKAVGELLDVSKNSNR